MSQIIFVKTEKLCHHEPNDIFHILIIYSKNIQPIFPQLISFIVFQAIPISEVFRDALLFAMAGGSSLRTFTWNSCSNQTHYSRTFF